MNPQLHAAAPARASVPASAGTLLFDAGFVIRTPAAMAALVAARTTESQLMQRHQSGDFGELPWGDEQANWRALRSGGALQSIYTLGSGARVRIVTLPELRTTTLDLLETA
ncbi:hypothetical protein M8A51_13695 [Schlegelella sp. S2-27]|uniref:Uncharacterized protein n=1 Tax=Caldimonas mangrovi TaxID=2944811 RepID=A0ABT0YR13_9BURK|nr:hypothetical protein [Caldimonas mangrovi]MCM5680581.1 hypothetical protein [Caldimonas mangrovi]